MKLDKKVQFAETVFSQEVDGEMVLLDMNTENYFGLDEVGSFIWQTIEAEGGALEKVLDVLLEAYDVDEDVLRRDLLNFVERLAESGLVQVVED